MVQRAREEGNATSKKVQSRLSTLSCPSELRRIDGVSGDIERRAVAEARTADLVVALRPYGAGRKTVWLELVEALLFGTGRALLLQPPDGKPAQPITRPFVCWNESREATRAVAEAMPFLRAAQSVVLAMVDPDTGSGAEWHEPGAAMARHLARHGVKTELMNVAAGSHASAEALLRAAESRGADLIVLGGYGHSRLREWALGGVTRDMLTSANVPLLIAH
jgi:nucleotide-binding universal stress UspA family protein